MYQNTQLGIFVMQYTVEFSYNMLISVLAFGGSLYGRTPKNNKNIYIQRKVRKKHNEHHKVSKYFPTHTASLWPSVNHHKFFHSNITHVTTKHEGEPNPNYGRQSLNVDALALHYATLAVAFVLYVFFRFYVSILRLGLILQN